MILALAIIALICSIFGIVFPPWTAISTILLAIALIIIDRRNITEKR